MDFFERQDHARRNTRLLIAYFITGVTLLVLSVYLILLLILAFYQPETRSRAGGIDLERMALWQPKILFGATLGTLIVVGSGSWFKARELARGGSAVASMLGGQLVDPHTTDPAERKLLNVVEEMAIASGVPVPQVYLLPREPGINAFAAGHGTADAAIGVTDGCMHLLTRDELQGVIAHEFSHMLNGDMRLNLRLMSVIFGILVLTVIGRILLQTRGRKNPLPLLGLALLLVGWAGVLFGRLIQAAVSRQREFLADASAVQFTRNPDGLAGALKKIGGLAEGSKLNSPHATEASHMFFGDGVKRSFLNLWATHPRLETRIRALEPAFDGRFAKVSPDATPEPAPPPFPAMASLAAPAVAARTIVPRIGTPERRHLHYAVELRDSLPAKVAEAAREPVGATTIVYALLLSDDLNLQGAQLDELATSTSVAVCEETLRLLPEVREVATRAKLPLLDLALPALRELSPPQFLEFRHAVTKLVESDRQIDLFEFMLQKVVLRQLQPQFEAVPAPVVQYYSFKPLAGDCAVVLKALAHVGQDDAPKAAHAFEQGAETLRAAMQTELVALPAPTEWDLSRVDEALNRLALAAPRMKRSLLAACAETVAADGVIQEAEAELLRAIAASLGLPLPPTIALE